MLETKLDNASLLKRLFESIRDLVTDVNLNCCETGFKLQAMDSSHVALIDVSLDECGFAKYRCDRAKALGFNMTTLCKIFKLCGNDDSLCICHEENGDTVSLVFESSAEDKVCNFDLKLLNVDQDILSIPESEKPDAVVRMPSKELAVTCRNLSEFSDTVTITIDKSQLKFTTIGDLGNGEIVIKRKESESGGGEDAVEIKLEESVKQSFAIKYLNSFLRAASLCDVVQLTLSNDLPLEMKFEVVDKSVSQKIGEMKFFLAPKLDDGGDENME